MLDIEKHGNMGTIESFYETDTDAEQAAAAMYVGLNSLYFDWYMCLNLLSDDAYTGGSGRGDVPSLEQINEYTYSSDNAYVTAIYKELYTLIYRANLVLENVEPDSSVKQRAYAEAYFFRAWAHFHLVALYGTAPIVDHVLSSAEYKQPNSTAAETWAFVEQDLLEAINSGWLPSKTGVNDDDTTCRITKEVAEAMLGKAYVFQEKYSEAASMLDKVIDSGLYALYTGDYGDLMHTEGNNCCESMFEIQKRNDTNNNLANSIWAYCGWRVDQMSAREGFDMTDWAIATYGFMNPQKGLYDAFVEWEGEDSYRLRRSVITFEQLYDECGIFINSGTYIYGCEGYLSWKLRTPASDQIRTGGEGNQWSDCPVMRYAEVLLLAAEAYYQSGNTSKALGYINQIRTRAQLPDLTSLTLDDIKTERRLELCMETCRYEDLIRWGDAATVLGGQGASIPRTTSVWDANGNTTGAVEVSTAFTNTTYGFQSKHYLLPIPAQEIEVNDNIVQNTGW